MIPHFILVASLLGAQTTPLHGPSDGLSELRSIRCEESLGALRAGAPALSRAIDADERADLQAAVNSAPELMTMRGGEMTEHDWHIVLLVLLGVLVLALIL